MNDETTLLSCPFCGREALYVEDIWLTKGLRWYVFCPTCGATGGQKKAKAEAVAAWNTRNELESERFAELEAENKLLRKAGYEIGYHDAMKAAKRGGMLTAEQVMTIAGKHQPDYCSDTHVCFDWQAVADELNAELESGECELVYGENDYGDDGWWCQSCGEWFAASFRHTGRNNIIKPSYCQHCGKAVRR